MMKTRLVVEGEDAVYHVVSRVALGNLVLKDEEKHVFRKLMRKQAAFCGVEVLTYCLLDGHFHILVRIPFVEKVSDNELVKRYSALYGDSNNRFRMTPDAVAHCLQAGGEKAAQLRGSLLARMGNISIFMKELKQRFTIWFNRSGENEGTLWTMRFSSVLVENVNEVLKQVAAYIDSNPMRLGLAQNFKDYRFCGMYEAMKGEANARSGLSSLFKRMTWPAIAAEYRGIARSQENQHLSGMSPSRSKNRCAIGSQSFVDRWESNRNAPPIGTKTKIKRWGTHCLCGALWIASTVVAANQFARIGYRNP